MENSRQKKISKVLQKDVAEIIQEKLKKQGARGVLVSVTKVDVSADFSLECLGFHRESTLALHFHVVDPRQASPGPGQTPGLLGGRLPAGLPHESRVCWTGDS